MTTIKAQLDWEQDMINRGIHRFRSQQAKAIEGRAHETSAGSRILHNYILTVSDHIKLYLNGKHPAGRRRNKYAKLLSTVDTDKVALFALRGVLGAVFNSGASLAGVCTKIGRACEDELRFCYFQSEFKEYYDTLIRDFERKNTTSYRHKRRVLAGKSKDKGLEWNDWGDQEAFGVGALVISLVMEVSDLIERVDTRKNGRSEARLVPTEQCVEWITRHNEIVEVTSPDRMPCIVPPADWISVYDGGYYSPQIRRNTPLIKTSNKSKLRSELYNNAEMPDVLSAVNAMQATPWRINKRVLSVMREIWSKNLGCGMPRSEPYDFPVCPLAENQDAKELEEEDPRKIAFDNWKAQTRELHTLEKERVAKNLALVRTMRIASEMENKEKFWYVYQCDFRGRVYCTSAGLNPQGTDQSKGLIEFAEGKHIGRRGTKWFLINGANKYGYDKVSYEDRIKWVQEKKQEILAIADDPITNRGWAEADKPYQFLAWCFEYADYSRTPYPERFVSHLPVGVDGSCNGLQHFSAMLRDSVGGAAVNLLPNDKPADIYQEVGDTALSKIENLALRGEGGAINWLNVLPDGKIPRGMPKKPVMTLPYGSTQQACTSSVYSWMHENIPNSFPNNTQFRHALYMSGVIWGSIGDVVIAARDAMDWIQDCASILSKAGHPIQYNSLLGFPVLQDSKKFISRQIETQIGGRLQLRLATRTDDLNSRKQRQGSSPNLVHHADACHMMMCINKCLDKGIVDFAMIHDDFGTHACDTGILQEVIRSTFVELYTEYDILDNFKRVHEERHGIELPDLPERGDLDINDVLTSDYFFG
jgi:DNA-directed RNA polymerase